MPKPTEKDAYKLAEKLKQEGIIIFSFKGDEIGFASYGITKSIGNSLKVIASKMCRVMLGKKPKF